MNPILQGLEVSVLALTITFLALGVFILIMVVLKRLFPAPPEAERGAPPQAETPEEGDEGDEGAVVAAIAAALEEFRARGESGGEPEKGRPAWGTSRRSRFVKRKGIKK